MSHHKYFLYLVEKLDNDIAVAEAAGHGFSHRPVGEARNAGWTELDDFANTRSGYDKAFLRLFNPERTIKDIRAKYEQLTTRHNTQEKHFSERPTCSCGDPEPCEYKEVLLASYDPEEWKNLE